MKLNKIVVFKGTLNCVTGLHIGGSDTVMHIGGIDNQVIKNPITNEPYIPGSSLKGKMRSLLEWKSGEVKQTPLSYRDLTNSKNPDAVKVILQLFGMSGSDNISSDVIEQYGSTRLSFWDLTIKPEWLEFVKKHNQLLTEAKSENTIDRIAGTALNPRNTERVVAGTPFVFTLSLKIFEGDDEEKLKNTVLNGLKLLEMDSLGGSGSRGYGKVKFTDLTIDDISIQDDFNKLNPF